MLVTASTFLMDYPDYLDFWWQSRNSNLFLRQALAVIVLLVRLKLSSKEDKWIRFISNVPFGFKAFLSSLKNVWYVWGGSNGLRLAFRSSNIDWLRRKEIWRSSLSIDAILFTTVLPYLFEKESSHLNSCLRILLIRVTPTSLKPNFIFQPLPLLNLVRSILYVSNN